MEIVGHWASNGVYFLKFNPLIIGASNFQIYSNCHCHPCLHTKQRKRCLKMKQFHINTGVDDVSILALKTNKTGRNEF